MFTNNFMFNVFGEKSRHSKFFKGLGDTVRVYVSEAECTQKIGPAQLANCQRRDPAQEITAHEPKRHFWKNRESLGQARLSTAGQR